jgi:hypothetical protein
VENRISGIEGKMDIKEKIEFLDNGLKMSKDQT